MLSTAPGAAPVFDRSFLLDAQLESVVLGDTQFGSPTSTYLILRRSGEVVDDHVRQQMRAMLKRIESGELVRDWNLEQTAGTPVLHQLKREIAEHPIREVEALFLERKEKTGW